MVQSGLIIASTSQMSLLKMDIYLPLKFVYQNLLESGLVAPTLSNPMQPLFSRWYVLDERCEYHGGGLELFDWKLQKFQVSSLKDGEQEIGWVCEGRSYLIIISITKIDNWWQDTDDCWRSWLGCRIINDFVTEFCYSTLFF